MKISDKSGAKRALVIIVVSVLIIGAFVGGFFTGKSEQRVETQIAWTDSEVVYAEILDISDGFFHVKGLDVNDINGRSEFTFTANEKTQLVWRGTELSLSDFQSGGRIAFFYVGEVLESFPAQVQNVVKIKLLDDEL